MALTLDPSSAGIDVIDAGVKADFTAGERSLFFHLTKGFDLFKVESQGAEPGVALSAIGHVNVSTTGGTGLSGFEFGFVQLTKLVSGMAFYAGRKASEGSITVAFENAMPAALLLDSVADRTPFTRAAPRQEFTGRTVECGTSDHPALKVPRQLRNSGRNIDNFLFHVIDRRQFWTVLTAINPAGQRQHLAHLHWEVSHNVKLKWVGGEPRLASSTGEGFVLRRNQRGAPPEADLQALLAAPVPPQFNKSADAAMLQSFLGGRGPNRTELDSRFTNVPADFWA